MDISFIIVKFAFIPLLILTIYTLFIYRQLSHELRIFSWFVFFSAAIEMCSRIFWFQSINNMPFLHVYVAGGFCFISIFYQQILKGFINPTIIWMILAIFLVFTTINSLFIQPINTFNSYALTVESVLIIIFSLSTYTIMLNDMVKEKRVHLAKSLNWINSGLFIYYSSNLLIFYFGDIITQFLSKEVSLYIWAIHSFLLILMYYCFFVGLWHRPTN